MRAPIAIAALSAITLVSAIAAANDDVPVQFPERYKSVQAPHGMSIQDFQRMIAARHAEKTQSTSAQQQSAAEKVVKAEDASDAPNDPPLDGSFYAEIFPIFNEGFTGNSSFIRLGTTSSTASTFDVTVLGSPSDTLYGYGQITVPANSSPQQQWSDIVNATGATALANGDTSYAVYLDNSDQNSFYQHVIFNGTNLFFEDMTICPTGASIQGATNITNIHTTEQYIAAWPSTIYIHNLLDVQADYQVTARDSSTGLVVGTIADISVGPNSTYEMPFSWFEQQMNFTPSTSQPHVNLQFAATAAFAVLLGVGPNPTDIGGIFGMVVLNQQFDAVLNLSNKCVVNR